MKNKINEFQFSGTTIELCRYEISFLSLFFVRRPSEILSFSKRRVIIQMFIFIEFLFNIFFIEFKHTLDTSNTILPEKGSSGIKCSDGSSIPKVNWCDRNFDCIDYKDELSCQNDIIRKYIF
jgi:hypothetical protein